MPAKGDNRGTKRRKIEENKYVTIQESWGPPTRTKSVKNQADDSNQHQNKKLKTTRQKITTRINNITTLENKISLGPIVQDCLGWEEPRDWDRVLKEHRERIEKEEQERNTQLQKQKKKEDSWKLYNTCKEILENNDKSWKQKKDARIEENKRQERLHIARQKTRISIQKQENKQWEERLQIGMNILPVQEQEKENQRNTKLDLQELKTTRENLWKLRSKEKKLIETEQAKKIRKLDEKTERVIELLEEERKKLIKREKNLRISIKNKDNKKKKQELIATTWATYRWIT